MNTIKKTFPVLGMTCAACAVSVESMLKSTPGVLNASVNYANQTAQVEFKKDISTETLKKSVQAIGYDLITNTENADVIQEEAQQTHYKQLKKRTVLSCLLSLPVVVIGMFFMDMPYGNYISMVLAAPVVFWLGKSFFINAYKQAKNRRANMDTLVALSTGIAFAFSLFNTFFPEYWHSKGLHPHVYYEAASVVIAFISLGKLLEEKAKSNTSSAIKKLMGLQPKKTIAIIYDKETEINIADVTVGMTLVVKPGERIPVDGKVISGSSFVDESMISGEPVAVEKQKDSPAFAGTINQKGSFLLLAEKVGGDTILAQIIKVVKEAQGSKAPVQKLADKIAGVFVPIVIVLAVLTFTTWMWAGGENAFTHALLTSVTVLVIACPCALGLATPTAIMVGVGKGAENNILIRDAESLEMAHKVNAIVLDKTGTITEGKPVVSNLEMETKLTETDLNVLFSIESLSEHPLAEAVVQYLKKSGKVKLDIQKFESITGKGAKAEYNGEKYFVGNKMLLQDNNISLNGKWVVEANAWQQKGKTIIYFANSQTLLAVIAVTDKIKESSKKAIEQLNNLGIEVYMLTGDNEKTAAAVASEVGITNFKAGALPDEKAIFVKELQKEGKIVAMVGDGINDSHALAEADVSIAMGKGSDIAMDVAKMTLITSDLLAIPRAINLSRKTVGGIKQNLFWAFVYNIIGIPLAAGVLYPINGFLLDPMIAGAAMALSSVSVVSNSLRLKFVKL